MDFFSEFDFTMFASALIAAKRHRDRERPDVLCFDSGSLEWTIAVPGISEKAFCAVHNVWFSRKLGDATRCGLKRSPDMDSNLSWTGLKLALDVERAMRLLPLGAFEKWVAPMSSEDAAFAIEWIYRDRYL